MNGLTKRLFSVAACIRRRGRYLSLLLAIWFAVLGTSPCGALSGIVDDFVPVSPQEAARWMDLLGLKPSSGVQIKSLTVDLMGTKMSMTRIETAACTDDGVCWTVFKYDMGKTFEFVIPCKVGILLLDVTAKDTTGTIVFPVTVFTAHNLETTIQPSSVGPLLTTSRHR